MRLLAACAIVIVGTLAARAQEPARDLAADERAFVAAAIYSAVTGNFAHWDALPPDFDFDAIFREYLKTAVAAPTREDFDWATMALLARLKNGHTQFFDRPVFMENAKKGSGFALADYEGKYVVVQSDAPGLRAGDVLVSVDGQPIGAFIESKLRYLGFSSPAAVLRGMPNAGFLWPMHYTLRLEDGREVRIDRGTGAPPAVTVEGRMLRPDVAYIRIPGFDDPSLEKRALELVQQFAQAQTIVFDLRGNGGGSTPADLTKALMDRPYRWWREATPQTLAVLKFRGEYAARPQFAWGPEVKQPDKPIFTGRILLLVDRGCGSSCEDFAMPFKDNGRGTLVGEHTAGSTGQPYIRELDNGMIVLVGSIRASMPDGTPFEGVGIAPDVAVRPTIEDLKSGSDVALAKALEIAGR